MRFGPFACEGIGMDATMQPEALDLTGRWRVIHHVQKSSRTRYVGLNIEFQVTLIQDGDKVTGEGEKFLVDWQLANREETSRLAIEGSVDDSGVRISLLERSPKNPERAILGEISWRPVNNNHMVGSFRVDAADTSGSSEAVRRVV